MPELPFGLSSFGVGSDNLGEVFHLYFISVSSSKKVYLGDDCLTEDLSEAITSDDMRFIIDELNTLLADKDFLLYLTDELAPF